MSDRSVPANCVRAQEEKFVKFRRGGSAVAALAAILAYGCAFMVPMDPRVPVMELPDAKLPVKVGLVIDDETRTKEANDIITRLFVYPVGEALEKIASSALASVFTRVQRVDRSHPLPSGLDGAVQILIDEAFLTLWPVDLRRDFASSTILLKCHVSGKEGKIIATVVARGYARGFWHPPTIFAPRSAQEKFLGAIADEALQRAMRELLGKFREDDMVKRLASLPD